MKKQIIYGGDYSMCCSTAAPQLIIFLVDTSFSMKKKVDGSSCVQKACDYVNKVLDTMIRIHFVKDRPKNRLFIRVAVYDSEVEEVLSGYLSSHYDNPLRIEKVVKKVASGDGGLTEVEIIKPVWLELSASQETANLEAGIEYAKDMLSMWVKENYDTPAPIVVNITCENIPVNEPLAKGIQQLKRIRTSDGETLFMNLVVGAEEKLVFPVIPEKEGMENSLIRSSSYIPINYQGCVWDEGRFVNNPSRVAYSTEITPIMNLLRASGR